MAELRRLATAAAGASLTGVAASDHPAVVPPRLFVYGTLQPGRLRWPVLAPFATGHRPASVPGTLHDTGNGWPVAVFDGGRR